jgi:hypothetical protein
MEKARALVPYNRIGSSVIPPRQERVGGGGGYRTLFQRGDIRMGFSACTFTTRSVGCKNFPICTVCAPVSSRIFFF